MIKTSVGIAALALAASVTTAANAQIVTTKHISLPMAVAIATTTANQASRMPASDATSTTSLTPTSANSTTPNANTPLTARASACGRRG